MGQIVEYDPLDTIVANRVINYFKSVNTPDYQTGNYLINPDLSGVAGINKKYWKEDNGSVIEMISVEKDAIDNALDTSQEANVVRRKYNLALNRFCKMVRRLRRKSDDWSMTPSDRNGFLRDIMGDSEGIFQLYCFNLSNPLVNFIDAYDTINAKFTQAIQNVLIGILEDD